MFCPEVVGIKRKMPCPLRATLNCLIVGGKVVTFKGVSAFARKPSEWRQHSPKSGKPMSHARVALCRIPHVINRGRYFLHLIAFLQQSLADAPTKKGSDLTLIKPISINYRSAVGAWVIRNRFVLRLKCSGPQTSTMVMATKQTMPVTAHPTAAELCSKGKTRVQVLILPCSR